MNYLSVCSGIDAASVAWEGMGWSPVAFSEIEKFPSAVLAHHFPDVPNWGDMTKFQEWPDANVDVLVGGTPCQSFSVAGLRRGLDDPRGNLALTYLAIAERYRPEWLVWENVPGVLSSNRGRDFGSFLGALGKLGYGFSYRVLDAQYFGVPQRRRRVFVVANATDWRRAAAVLFERESMRRDSPPSREAGEGFAHDVAPSLVSSGRGVERIGETRGQDPVIACFGAGNTSGPIDPAATLTAKGQRLDYEVETFAVQSVTGDVANTLNTANNGKGCSEDGTGRGVPTIAQTVALRGREGGATAELGGDCATALRASSGGGDKPHVLATMEVAGTMKACARSGGWSNSADHAAAGYMQVTPDMAVRRLTPVECERLQGFPDDHTRIPWRNKDADDCPDGPRYRAIGNSMAVPVMRWIGARIAEVDAFATTVDREGAA